MRKRPIASILVISGVIAGLLASCAHGGGPAQPADLASPPGGDSGCVENCTTDGPGPAVDMAPGAPGIQHIIVIVKENHTFDNYFGSFPGAEGTSVAKSSTRGDIPVGRPPLVYTRDLQHGHPPGITAWHGGLMDQWDLADPPNVNDNLAYDQYIEDDIPNYWALAKSYALADHFHSGMLGPSFPGHMFYYAAQAGWAWENPTQTVPWGCDNLPNSTIPVLDGGGCVTKDVFPCFKIPVIPDVLPPTLTWGVYATTLPPLVGEPWTMLDAVDQVRNTPAWKSHVFDVSQFASDIKAGILPNVVWVVNQDLASEHPPFNVCSGENWTINIVNQVMESPFWSSSAIFIGWDDSGGWYDHVPPPKQYGCDATSPYGYGFRLPLIMISPWVKPHQIYSKFASQASVPKFIESVFGLPSLHSIDPAAQDGPDTDDLMSAFDFKQAPNPPMALPIRDCLLQR
jgi:phospholipase C